MVNTTDTNFAKTTASEMARAAGVDPKRFRTALRAANFQWHSHNERWVVSIDSPEHSDMQGVLAELA